MTELFDRLELKYSAITEMWRQAEICSLDAFDSLPISLALFRPSTKRISGVVLILPGRGEIMTKYGELISDLLHKGTAVAIYDHRGQGFSSTLLSDKRIGYVKNFEDYTKDLQIVLSFLKKQKRFKHINLVAHSMGGAITLDYLTKFDNSYVSKVLLVSPMLALPLNPFSMNVLRFISHLKQFKWMLSVLASALPGRGRDKKIKFEGNPYSHDFERFTYFRAVYPRTDSLSTPGVSLNWLSEAIKVTKKLNINAKLFDTPVSIIISGSDVIVDNKPVAGFCSELHRANHMSPDQPLVIDNAYHELHLESDEFRDIFLKSVCKWLYGDLIMNDETSRDKSSKEQKKDENADRQDEPKGLYRYYPMKLVHSWKQFIKRLSQLS